MVTSLRAETNGLVNLADKDLNRLWALIRSGTSAESALHDLLPTLIREYGALGASAAADWYDDQRELIGARKRFSAIPVAADDRGADSLIGWALSQAKDDVSLQSLILGGVQRRIADHVRYTIAGSSIEDPAARGWQRVGNGGCTSGFCDMLISRGAVYTEASADFASHDHCQCSAVPAWEGEPRPVKPFTPSLREATDADKARVRDYIATH